VAATSIDRRYDCRALCGDTIVGFERQDDAERFLEDLSARMADFGLGLHPEKTRLIEFGRKAIATRRARGLGKPETFDFLGFTHYCATRRSGGGFVLGRTPARKRMRAKLRQIKEQLKATRHDGVEAQGKWLARVLRGWSETHRPAEDGKGLPRWQEAMFAAMGRNAARMSDYLHLPYDQVVEIGREIEI
jgi:RNA-directed DNA polymerase